MKKITIYRIGFGSYIKFFILSGASLGIIMGIFFLIVGLMGGPVTAHIGNTSYSGLTAGVLGVFIAPLVCSLIFAIFSFFMYLPFKLLLKVFRGIKMNVQLQDDVFEKETSRFEEI